MSFDAKSFRTSMGRFATGVCVITASAQPEGPFGLTVNSFSSLSLDPPLILWNLGCRSDTYSAWDTVERFAVNVLRESQQALSVKYSRRGQHRLETGDFEINESGCPVLIDCLATFECSLQARHPGGDHEIMVGHVTDLRHCEAGRPLLFFAGQYRALD